MGRAGVANIVHELQKRGFDPRRVGADSWVSRCPAHGGADHTLSITRDETNKVQLECRSTERCLYGRIIGAVRLGYDTLFTSTSAIPPGGRWPSTREVGASWIGQASTFGGQTPAADARARSRRLDRAPAVLRQPHLDRFSPDGRLADGVAAAGRPLSDPGH
jgi:hypothetical protein